jgi:hypothetical protein
VSDDLKQVLGIISIIMAVVFGICAIIYCVQRHDQACYDQGLIWVPTIQGHWEQPKQPAEKEKQ